MISKCLCNIKKQNRHVGEEQFKPYNDEIAYTDLRGIL